MKRNSDKLKIDTGILRFVPKIWAVIVFFLLLAMAFVLFSSRKKEALRFDFIKAVFPDFHYHISNFSLGFVLYAGVGFMWLMLGVKPKLIVLFGGVLLLVNFAYEWWIPMLNTPDPIDAYFGFAGILLAGIFLLFTAIFGLRENPLLVSKNATRRRTSG